MLRCEWTRAERGAVVVIVAVALTGLLGMATIVVDLANWWVHKRHLQEQADSAALAGAQLLNGSCSSTPATMNAKVAQEADKYAGAANWTTGLSVPAVFKLNGQIGLGSGESVAGALNSKTYPDGQTDRSGEQNSNPCADAAVDVKLTDQNLPYLFTVGALAGINVHARVEVRKISSVKGTLPFAAEDPMPKTVKALFVDTSGTGPVVLASGALTNPKAPNDPAYDPGSFTGSVSVPMPAGSSPDPVELRINASGTGSVTNDAGPCHLTSQQCYDASAPTGLVELQAWPDATTQATGSNVAVTHAVRLTNVSGCTATANSTTYFSVASGAGPCLVTVDADVEFNSGAGVNYPTIGSAGDKTNSTVTVSDGLKTCAPNSQSMVYKGAVNGFGSHVWEGVVCAVPGSGTTPISMQAVAYTGTVGKSDCSKGSGCAATSNPVEVQRFFTAANSASGNIDSLTILDAGGADAYSQNTCTTNCTRTFQVSVHFRDLLQPGTQQVLRSQGNTVNCSTAGGGTQNNSNTGLYEDITGLDPNTGQPANTGCMYAWFRAALPTESCPDPATQAATASTPSECAYVRNGNGTNANNIGKALSVRILGSTTTCTAPSHWPVVTNGDPRAVTLFTIFQWPTANNAPLPITGFAQFYVTAWALNGGAADPCGDPLPAGASDGDVYGYFMNSDVPSGFGQPGLQQCDFANPTPCIPVLVD